MSNTLAIATVTATLQQMLLNAVGIVPGVDVTTDWPGEREKKRSTPGVNIYLYQVAANAAWRNADLPARNPDGQLVQRPQVALNLYYLLTFYGDETKLWPQRLLGSAVLALHARPVLSRKQIDKVIEAARDPTHPVHPYLADSNLAESIELIKFSPITLNLEELSKLWSVFFQTPYALSAAYQASVVLIEGEETPRAALPVQKPSLYVVPFRRPIIESAVPDRLEAGGVLTLQGKNLLAEVTGIRFGETLVQATAPTDSKIEVTLPASLLAGVNGVQVVHEQKQDTPPKLYRISESNIMPFILLPRITTPPPITVTRGANFILDVSPPVARSQRVTLVVGEEEIRIPQRPETDPPATTKLVFPIPAGFSSGDFLLRLRVDGAESSLTADSTGRYNAPMVKIT